MLLSGQEYVDVYAASLKKVATPEDSAPSARRIPDSKAS
jgi:1-acyl-sn-glycerol-3-phosphate acyltransferase